MTEDQMQNVKDDIAFMRALAAEGQGAPLLGGRILAAAGLIFAIASLAYWAMIVELINLPHGWGSFGIWMGALAIFLVTLTILNRGIHRKPGAGAPANRATGSAWMAVGMAIFAMGVSYAAAGYKLETEMVMVTFPSVIFALYGAGWAVAAAMTSKRWLWGVAIASWMAAPVLAWFADGPEQYLVYAAALLLLTFLPGVILTRQEPTDIV